MNDILIILLRTILGYAILIVLMKFMGKREIGQLSLFDLLILLTIVDIMVVGIENFKINYWYCLLPMVGIALVQKIMALISLKSVRFRNFIDGKECLIIEKGVINVKAMKKNGYNMDDLYVQIRKDGYASPTEIEYAILENSGELVVFPKSNHPSFPLPLILSGRMNRENIIKAGYTTNFIEQFVKSNGYNSVKEVYGLEIVGGALTFVEVSDNKTCNK
ncbi:MAG: DUF421 domain-containing protein [Bacilli bacterium]|nr:DUF421 domain-containing protein [Bacilli bacterium]